MTIEDELLALGKENAEKWGALVDKWRAENPNFIGMLENSAIPGLRELQEETKQKHFEILKKYNKI